MKISNKLSAQVRKAVIAAKSDLHDQEIKFRDIVGCDIFVYLEENTYTQEHEGEEKKVLWRVNVEFSNYYGTEYEEFLLDLQHPMDKSVCNRIAATIIEKRSIDGGDYVLSIDDPTVAVNFKAFCKEADRKYLNRAKSTKTTNQGIYDEYFRLVRNSWSCW